MIHLAESVYKFENLDTDFLRWLCKRTINAILIVTFSFVISLVLLITIWLLFHTTYCLFALAVPLFAYMWINYSVGARYVNNHYGIKNTSKGFVLYEKKRNAYRTYTWVFIIIFYISSSIRLIYEIHNLTIINNELRKRLV